MRKSGSFIDFQKDGEILNKYYNALVVHDQEREVLVIPFHTIVELDLDQIKNAQDLLAWVLVLIGKTPGGWNENNWDKACFIRHLVARIGEIKGWSWVNDYLGAIIT